uniref:Uncharacterized protein n=1 Tax=Cyanothece sp. (strain PCC 7425 / ATCC 29141) TaxID=395961 RepID=B8HUB6_CYAP4
MPQNWSPEAREAARQRILKNKPWEKSTGPKTEAGKFIVSFNAAKEGLRFSNPLLRHAARKAAKEQLDEQSREQVRRIVLEFVKLKKEAPALLLDALDYGYRGDRGSLQCPYCEGRYLTKKGFTGCYQTGRQRWFCKDCRKTFSL